MGSLLKPPGHFRVVKYLLIFTEKKKKKKKKPVLHEASIQVRVLELRRMAFL